MAFEMNLALCVLVVLTGSSQTRGQSSVVPPVRSLAALQSHIGASAPPDLTEDPGNEVSQWTHNPAGRDETSAETTAITNTEGIEHPDTATNAAYETYVLTTSSAAATSQHTNAPVLMTAHPDSLSSAPTVQSPAEGRAILTTDPLTTFSSQPAHTVQDTSSSAHASTIQSESLTTAATQPTTTGHDLTSAPGRGPTGPTHREVPSELNVGDEDLKRPRSPLDPLLAGLLSVFIVTTAVVFVVLFLKFRQRTNHPEFHRLQDLPMDDLMEDTPLSRYTY